MFVLLQSLQGDFPKNIIKRHLPTSMGLETLDVLVQMSLCDI